MSASGFRHAINEHERTLLETCDAVLARHVGTLREAGFDARVLGISDLPHSSAEVTIDFLGPGGVQDVLEFTIARDGAPTLKAAQLAEWLETQLPTVGESQA
jgi:hypothetical protein